MAYLPNAEEQIATLTAERDEARDWVRKIQNETRILTCAFCGEAYPPNTPTHNDEALRTHIMNCEKHPLRQRIIELEAENARLKAITLGSAPLPESPKIVGAQPITCMRCNRLISELDEAHATINQLRGFIDSASDAVAILHEMRNK